MGTACRTVLPIPPGGVGVTLVQRSYGVCSHDDLTDVLMPAWKRSDDADEELKAATATFDVGDPDAAERLQAAVDKAEVAREACYIVEEELGIGREGRHHRH